MFSKWVIKNSNCLLKNIHKICFIILQEMMDLVALVALEVDL